MLKLNQTVAFSIWKNLCSWDINKSDTLLSFYFERFLTCRASVYYLKWDIVQSFHWFSTSTYASSSTSRAFSAGAISAWCEKYTSAKKCTENSKNRSHCQSSRLKKNASNVTPGRKSQKLLHSEVVLTDPAMKHHQLETKRAPDIQFSKPTRQIRQKISVVLSASVALGPELMPFGLIAAPYVYKKLLHSCQAFPTVPP